eukprot:1609029-Prymnesium_polylepis.5
MAPAPRRATVAGQATGARATRRSLARRTRTTPGRSHTSSPIAPAAPTARRRSARLPPHVRRLVQLPARLLPGAARLRHGRRPVVRRAVLHVHGRHRLQVRRRRAQPPADRTRLLPAVGLVDRRAPLLGRRRRLLRREPLRQLDFRLPWRRRPGGDLHADAHGRLLPRV